MLNKKEKIFLQNLSRSFGAVFEDYLIDQFRVSKCLKKPEKERLEFQRAVALFKKEGFFEDIDSFCLAFQFILFDDSSSKKNGAVYTPKSIRSFMLSEVLKGKTKAPVIMDPACGCGAFLVTAAEMIVDTFHLSYKEAIENNVFGNDIDPRSARVTKKMLLLAGELHHENVKKLNITSLNSLSPEFSNQFSGKFDAIVGNPPYVRARNMTVEDEAFAKGFSYFCGNSDLYILFFELSIKCVKEDGLVALITPNTYLKSVNGRGLRNDFLKRRLSVKVFNFGSETVFDGISAYFAITFLSLKVHKNPTIEYGLLDSNIQKNSASFTVPLLSFEPNEPWILSSSETDDQILKVIKNQPHRLGNFKIRNGIATLKNKLFFFTPTGENGSCYSRIYKGKKYLIEKESCRPIIKPNIIKNKADLSRLKEQAIFPYYYENGKCLSYSESQFKEAFPKAYSFLLNNKEELLKRDKGDISKYPTWFSYGRTQGLNLQGKKVLFPYICGHPIAVYSADPALLFYCGYAVFSEDKDDLALIESLMTSELYWFYILKTSKPYAKGYMSVAKNYVVNFGYPVLSDNDKKDLIDKNVSFEVKNRKLCALYGIDYDYVHAFVSERWEK